MDKRGIVAPAASKIASRATRAKVVFAAGMMMEGITFMTAIHYRDIVAWSPSRNFRCEATSPYNLPEWHPSRVVSPTELVWPGAFQEDFEFTLYEGTSDEVRWTVPQAQVSEISPHAIHVSDSGWCVVRTHGPFSAGLVTISPEGRVVHAVDLLQDVFVGRWSGYIHGTSAGPFWALLLRAPRSTRALLREDMVGPTDPARPRAGSAGGRLALRPNVANARGDMGGPRARGHQGGGSVVVQRAGRC